MDLWEAGPLVSAYLSNPHVLCQSRCMGRQDLFHPADHQAVPVNAPDAVRSFEVVLVYCSLGWLLPGRHAVLIHLLGRNECGYDDHRHKAGRQPGREFHAIPTAVFAFSCSGSTKRRYDRKVGRGGILDVRFDGGIRGDDSNNPANRTIQKWSVEAPIGR